jgi:uncharacterized membrane protein
MSPRTLKIALVTSVALNLFSIGAVVGGFAIAHRLHGTPGPAMGMGTGPLWSAADGLPQAQREAYRRRLQEQSTGLRDQVHAARQARRQAWLGLTQEPLNANKVSASLAEARALETKARSNVEEAIVAFAASLPAQERAELAKGLTRPGPKARLEDRRMHRRDPSDLAGPQP